MGVEDIIAKARQTLTSAHGAMNLAEGHLRSGLYIKRLYENLEKLDYRRNTGVFGKLKAAMFEDTASERADAKELLDDTYLLNNCIKCRCADCAAIGPDCTCKACVYGTYGVACDGRVRKNASDPDVLVMDGYSDIRTEVDIATGAIRYFGTDYYGVERTINL